MNLPRPHANVLVVEDEEDIRRLVGVVLTRFIQDIDVHVTEAASGEEAIAALEHADFDLVITDYSMPGKNGIDVLQKARELSPRTARVLVTALAEMDIGVEAVNRGRVDGFVRKPWDNEAFLALVEDLLRPRAKAAAPVEREIPVVSRAQLEAEKGEIERQLGQLRVRLGLGHISPEGYQRMAHDLSKRRTELEIALLQSGR